MRYLGDSCVFAHFHWPAEELAAVYAHLRPNSDGYIHLQPLFHSNYYVYRGLRRYIAPKHLLDIDDNSDPADRYKMLYLGIILTGYIVSEIGHTLTTIRENQE
jgi:hypothetical protein